MQICDLCSTACSVLLSVVVDKNFTFSAQTVKMRKKHVMGGLCVEW